MNEIETITQQLLDIKRSIIEQLDIRKVKTMNPKYGFDDKQPKQITTKELNDWVIERWQMGLIGDDLVTESLMNSLKDIDSYVEIQKERLNDYWRKTAEILTILDVKTKEMEEKLKVFDAIKIENEQMLKDYEKIEIKEKKLKELSHSLKNITVEFNEQFDKLSDKYSTNFTSDDFKKDMKELHNELNRKFGLSIKRLEKVEVKQPEQVVKATPESKRPKFLR